MRAKPNGRSSAAEQLGDAELLARGDVDSFAEFYRRHARRLAGYLVMEVYRSNRLVDPETGEEYQPAELPCLGVALLDPPSGTPTRLGGGCGEFPRTPGFGRAQISVPPVKGGVREILVYGRAPEHAAAVVITAAGGVRTRVEPFEGPPSVSGDFYLIEIPPDLKNGRVNWIDREGHEGSRGIALLPP